MTDQQRRSTSVIDAELQAHRAARPRDFMPSEMKAWEDRCITLYEEMQRAKMAEAAREMPSPAAVHADPVNAIEHPRILIRRIRESDGDPEFLLSEGQATRLIEAWFDAAAALRTNAESRLRKLANDLLDRLATTGLPGGMVEEIREALADADAHCPVPKTFDLIAHMHRARAFSFKTFGPGMRTKGVCDHIRKELSEIESDQTDVVEWIDVIILGLDGAWRAGYEPEEIAAAIEAKQTKNESRRWPDWRTADPDKAIEHDRSAE